MLLAVRRVRITSQSQCLERRGDRSRRGARCPPRRGEVPRGVDPLEPSCGRGVATAAVAVAQVGKLESVLPRTKDISRDALPRAWDAVAVMLYAILCYDSDDVVGSWTKEQDDAVMVKLAAVQDVLAKQGKLGPVARLASTKQAKTLRKGDSPLLVDGPFAETKEQLLGFFIVDCATFDEAADAARDLARASSSKGAYEIRPLTVFAPGSLAK